MHKIISSRFFKLKNISLKFVAVKFNLHYCTFNGSSNILGIETSCDDTGIAVINGKGNILGHSLFSQNALHVKFGGVNPLVARDLHKDNIELAVDEALKKSGLVIQNIDFVAVTIKPGLLVSLQVGVKYAKYLSNLYNKPLIPIHHMEAHALVARMYHSINFPFLALLISGGHCLLTLVKNVDEFYLLGNSLDNAPGEVLDKAARRMKLRNLPIYSNIAGGRAIEMAAMGSENPHLFDFPLPLVKNRDCNFSFSGIKDALNRHLLRKEQEHDIQGDELIPEVNDLCAAVQLIIARHIVHRTERAVHFCLKNDLLDSKNKNIVVSGGVACNNFIYKSVQYMGTKLGFNVLRPPPEVCTDNGIMIAWNAIEKLKACCPIEDITLKNIDPKAPLGIDIINQVQNANIYIKAPNLKEMLK